MHQITLMEAYLIETLRHAEITDDAILRGIEDKTLDAFAHVAEQFDFTMLYDLENEIREILAEGYQVKFLTFPGLQNMLKLKFQRLENKDYHVEGHSISGLMLDQTEEKVLRSFLSSNWHTDKAEDGITIKPIS